LKNSEKGKVDENLAKRTYYLTEPDDFDIDEKNYSTQLNLIGR